MGRRSCATEEKLRQRQAVSDKHNSSPAILTIAIMCCPHPCHGAGGACAAGGARQGRPPRGATPDAEAHRQGLP